MNNSLIFSEIYEKGIWNDNLKTIPLSGPGSSLENTIKYRQMLDHLVKELNVKTIVDLGCGDLTWMPHTNAFQVCEYTGIDVVKSLINAHTEKFKDKKFLCLDMTIDQIPGGDLVIIRDVLFHLSIEKVLAVLQNIKGKFKHYLITSCNNIINDDNMNKFHFHNLNLRIEPFNLKNYKVILEEPGFKRDILLFGYDFLCKDV